MIILLIIILTIISEVILFLIFSVIAKYYYKKNEINLGSLFKGLLERLFLVLFLYNDIPHALTVFSALKIATRLKHEEASEETQRFNNYYLIGNLISVSSSLFYLYLWRNATAIEKALYMPF
jgi:hypothetical protein